MSDKSDLNSNPSQSSAVSSGVKCPNCGTMNRAGVLICENCGTSLFGGQAGLGTRKFQGDKEESGTEAVPMASSAAAAAALNEQALIEAVSTAGSAVFDEDMVLRLEVEGAPTPILIYPKNETAIGRRDPATGTMPDVDLTSYAGYRMGVSRRHAIIRLKSKQLEIYDLGSSNGTSVNGVRLAAHQPHQLRDGDEIALGKMLIRVLFHKTNRG